MSERWVAGCERILEQIRSLSYAKDQDRLEVVRSMRFTLNAIYRSVVGWLGWVNNPDVMAEFSLEELKEMNETLIKFAESFIEYDAKVTSKGPRKVEERRDLGRTGKPEGFYV
ncbi:DUF2153 family protein [Candidatus Bathyarchaeota archaeon]|nr:DUF2153 family protein [Candidatus Bathyarchaeota archaeon]